MSGGDEAGRRYIGQLEQTLAASEERYRTIFEEDPAARFVATPEGRLFDGNAALARVFGLNAIDQLLGRQLQEFFHDPGLCEQLLTRVRASGRVDAAVLALTRVDGDPVNVVMWMTAAFGGDRRLVSVSGRLFDVTEFERLRVRLVGARRMEAIGRLAGGIAHEFNNLLMVIDVNAERLVSTLTTDPHLASAATAIQKAARRAASLTRQVLAFGRRQVFEWCIVDVPTLVEGTHSALERTLGKNIELRFAPSAALPSIRADRAQLEHVLVTLALNAREAMPGGGLLTVRVDMLSVDADARDGRPYIRPGSYVRLRITDTGVGMDAATQAHVFEPFFTTKQVGIGTGLGLASVYGTVKQSGGYIWVESEIGRGTTFTLLFPALTGKADSAPPERSTATPYETILVLEHDDEVRALTVDSLERVGYQVLEAKTTGTASEIRAAFGSRIHLLVGEVDLDDGPRSLMVRQWKTADPLLQILYVGDGSTSSTNHRLLAGMPFIRKPFTQRALAEKVREVLDSGEGR